MICKPSTLTTPSLQRPKLGTSFLGRTGRAQLHKAGSGHSNSRSYVFAREDSRSAQPAAVSPGADTGSAADAVLS